MFHSSSLVVAEQRRLLDLADVDVLDRIAHIVEGDRPARRVDLQRRHRLDEFFGAGELAAIASSMASSIICAVV